MRSLSVGYWKTNRTGVDTLTLETLKLSWRNITKRTRHSFPSLRSALPFITMNTTWRACRVIRELLYSRSWRNDLARLSKWVLVCMQEKQCRVPSGLNERSTPHTCRKPWREQSTLRPLRKSTSSRCSCPTPFIAYCIPAIDGDAERLIASCSTTRRTNTKTKPGDMVTSWNYSRTTSTWMPCGRTPRRLQMGTTV